MLEFDANFHADNQKLPNNNMDNLLAIWFAKTQAWPGHKNCPDYPQRLIQISIYYPNKGNERILRLVFDGSLGLDSQKFILSKSQVDNVWQKHKLIIQTDGYVRFLLDGRELYMSPNPIVKSEFSKFYLAAGGRSNGRGGNHEHLVDNLKLSEL